MTDCPNAEIRDRLPDLLHERLDASTRVMVAAHVAGCADCRAELELLRSVQSSLMSRTPQVDVSAIVAALPKPPKAAPTPAPIALASRRPRTWVDWRVAAAITVLAVGAGSYTLVRQQFGDQPVNVGETRPPVAQGVQTPNVSAPAPNSGQPVASTNTTPAPGALPASRGTAPAESANPTVVVAESDAESAPVSNLSQRQLKTLLDDIDRMPAIPLTDVEQASIKINVKASTPSSPEGM